MGQACRWGVALRSDIGERAVAIRLPVVGCPSPLRFAVALFRKRRQWRREPPAPREGPRAVATTSANRSCIYVGSSFSQKEKLYSLRTVYGSTGYRCISEILQYP